MVGQNISGGKGRDTPTGPLPDLSTTHHGGKEKPDDTPPLNWFMGEFDENRLEKEYCRATWAKRIRHLRLVALPAAVIFLVGALVDIAVVGPDSPLVAFIVATRLVVAGALSVLALTSTRVGFRPLLLEWMTVSSIILVSAVTCGIVWVIRGELLLHALTALVLILVYYLVVPVRLISALSVSLVFSIGFVCSVVVFLNLRTDEMVQVVLYLTLVNVLGALVGRERHAGDRREFFRVRTQCRIARELRDEVDARTQAESALAESEQRFRSLVELSPDAILVHRDGRLLYINPVGERLMDVEETGELLGVQIMEFVLPEHRAVIAERLASLDRGSTELPTAEVEVRTVSGRVVACEVVSGLIIYEGRSAVQSVIRDIAERKRLREELTRLATTDSLTGIDNRRSFFDTYEIEWSRARRQSYALSLLMFDIDHFKRVNDEHGHAVGDAVLKAIVEPVGKLLREQDTLARLGGEEFVVLLPGVDANGAGVVAERLRQRLSEVAIEAPEGTVCCTVSVGVARCRLAQESPDGALKRADEALYAAKRSGRNRVVVG